MVASSAQLTMKMQLRRHHSAWNPQLAAHPGAHACIRGRYVYIGLWNFTSEVLFARKSQLIQMTDKLHALQVACESHATINQVQAT
jgi:hypothetical protein